MWRVRQRFLTILRCPRYEERQSERDASTTRTHRNRENCASHLSLSHRLPSMPSPVTPTPLACSACSACSACNASGQQLRSQFGKHFPIETTHLTSFLFDNSFDNSTNLFFFSSMCSPCFACIYFTSNFEKWHARISMHFWVQLLTHCIELWKFNVLKLKQVWYFDVFFTSFFASLLLLCKGSMETANESPLAGTLQISSDVLLEEFHLESFLTISLKRRNETWNLPWCCAFGHFSFSGRTGKSLSVLTCSSKGGTDGWLQPQPQAWPVWLEAGVSCQTQLEWNSLLSNCQTPQKNHSCFRIKSN